MVHHGPISPFTSAPPQRLIPAAATHPPLPGPGSARLPRDGVEGFPRSPQGAVGLGVGNRLEIQWEGHSWDSKKNILPSKAGELISVSSQESR